MFAIEIKFPVKIDLSNLRLSAFLGFVVKSRVFLGLGASIMVNVVHCSFRES